MSKKSSLNNTEELILICARTKLREDLAKKAEDLLKKGIDWEFFIAQATKNQMPYLFYNSLNSINCPSFIPEHVFEELKVKYLYSLWKTSIMHKEIRALFKLFSEQEIRVVSMKGPILAKRLYGDVAMRGLSVDVDFLVEEKNRKAAYDILENAGYLSIQDNDLSERLGQSLFRKKDGVTIDLHWEINPVVASPERMEGFWRGIRLKKKEDTTYYEFNEEELLLELSVHLVDSAHLKELRHLADINELLTKYRDRLNWESVIEKAEKWRLSNSLYTTLFMSRKLFGSYVPERVLRDLKPGLPKRILIEIFTDKKVIFDTDSFRRRFLDKFLNYILFQILEARSFRDYFSIAFPPKRRRGKKTHFERLKSGLSKFIGSLRNRAVEKSEGRW